VILKTIQASSLLIPFKLAFKHASAERATTQTLWVEASAHDGMTGFGEGCPREYVTAESLQSAQGFVAAHLQDWLSTIVDVATLADWVARHRAEIDQNPAAWTAVELALLDLIGKVGNKSVEALLGLPQLSGSFRYTAVLGDASPRQFEAQLAHYLQAGFRDIKIKLSGDRMRDAGKVHALSSAHIAPQAVRADSNNLWTDPEVAMRDLGALDFPFFALEEPLRAGDYQGMHRLARELDTRIVLDESLLRADQLDHFSDSADRWIVNLRVSKMGGLLRSLELVRELRRRGLRAIIGAHVGETSLLTRAALTVAHSARDILVAQEGAFGTHLLSTDVIEAPIMFGYGGMLDAGALGLASAGLGLPISEVPRSISFNPPGPSHASA
jgi:L-alanine-DL-glutamate epimerase-like enolase superfamily enzyme